MCLASRPLIARGIGEELQPVQLPPISILLVNPLKPVSTPQIFRLLTDKNNPPLPADLSARLATPLDAIRPLRNDLQPPAEALEPVITSLLEELAAAGADIARMSGSGATCFGLFASKAACAEAATRFHSRHPHWFIATTRTLP